MKKFAFLAVALLPLSFAAQAAPTEINYQGVLTDQNGNPVNGVRAMQIKIYDAPTGGTLLYSEDLGNVPVQDGIYSFSFGANGTSNALTTETIAIANGTVSTFQKVLAAPSVVAGSVTVTDGTYTWDQTNGSSNEHDFSVAYSPNLRRVTVTYYSGSPAAGKTISAKFRTPNSGIASSIGDIGNAWTEVSIGGTLQNPRQKILTIPFALYSKNLSDEGFKSSKTVNIDIQPRSWPLGTTNWRGEVPNQHNFYGKYVKQQSFSTPLYVKKIHYISLNFSNISQSGAVYGNSLQSISRNGDVSVEILNKSGNRVFYKQFTDAVLNKNENIEINLEIPFGDSFEIKFSASTNDNGPAQYATPLGTSVINNASMCIDVPIAIAW
jgi:hypothetical protein